MVMERTVNLPHYGGQMGIGTLLCMLSLTGCMAFTDQTGSLAFFPGWTQTQLEHPKAVEAQATPMTAPAATFIVRFNNEPILDTVCRNFRRDETGMRTSYDEWAANHRQLQGLRLVRASYSGELLLALPKNDPAGRSASDVIAALETIDSLAYAEIDSLATTSSGR